MLHRAILHHMATKMPYLQIISHATAASVCDSNHGHMVQGQENRGVFFNISHPQCHRTSLTVYAAWAVALSCMMMAFSTRSECSSITA